MNRLLEQKTSTLIIALLSIVVFFLGIISFQFYFVLFPNYQSFNIAVFFTIIIYNILFGTILLKDKNIVYILFSPLFWYKFIATLFYGIGPLAYYFGNDMTVSVMNLYFFITDETLNKISIIYILVILLTDLIFIVLNHFSTFRYKIRLEPTNKKLLLFYTLSIGVFSKYFVLIPSVYIGVNAPAIFQIFSTFTYAAIFLLYSIGQKNNSYKILFYIFVFMEMGSSFLVLSKEYLYMSIIFASFVVFFYSKNLKNIIFVGLISGILYITIVQNLFLVLRNIGEGNFGITSTEQLETAFDTARTITDGTSNGETIASFQAWWDRLSYAKYQGYAIEAYDMGYPGETFKQFKYIFIPRLIYPDKPNLNPGAAYNNLVQGSFSERAPNSTGPGLFIEAYWNGGWRYVIITIIYFAILLFYFSKIVIKNLKEKNYIILMLAVNAIYIGRGIDDWFVGRYGGFILNMIVLYLFHFIIYKTLEIILNTKKIKLNE